MSIKTKQQKKVLDLLEKSIFFEEKDKKYIRKKVLEFDESQVKKILQLLESSKNIQEKTIKNMIGKDKNFINTIITKVKKENIKFDEENENSKNSQILEDLEKILQK